LRVVVWPEMAPVSAGGEGVAALPLRLKIL
jgi:hypothetical protein